MSTTKDAINTYDLDNPISAGMLSSPQIAFCVKEYDIIHNFDAKCLGPATYNMRLGKIAFIKEHDSLMTVKLGESEDRNRGIQEFVELKPNALIFVTTYEKFNLPKDIIARFNLKSKWVHRGLLLGTGPIVDPELVARLLIPIHNFSSEPVQLHYKKEIISVEFTRTLNPSTTFDDKSHVVSESDTIKYVPNENRFFNPEKYKDRAGKIVSSSVLKRLEEYHEESLKFKSTLNKIRSYSLVGAVALFIALATLTYTTWSLIADAQHAVAEASNVIKQYKADNIDYRSFALKKELSDLEKDFIELKAYSERMYTELYQKQRAVNVKKEIFFSPNTTLTTSPKRTIQIRPQPHEEK